MDEVRLLEFKGDDGEGARTHGRRSVQSGRLEFITRGDRRRMWVGRQPHWRFDLTGFAQPC